MLAPGRYRVQVSARDSDNEIAGSVVHDFEVPFLSYTTVPINVITRVRSAAGQAVWETKDNGTSEALSGSRFGYIHSTLIPVSTLAPGQYVVEVGAETLYGVPGYVSRSVPFTILGAGAGRLSVSRRRLSMDEL